METKKILTILVLALGLMVCLSQVGRAEPMGAAFTYQGRLIDANEAADGLYDFQFKLYDDANVVDGNKVGSDVNWPDVDVIDGYFTVELDFNDVNSFNGDVRWLEIGVRPGAENDPCGYTPLVPRLEVTPVPYALRAESVSVPLALVASAPAGTAVLGVMNTGDGAVAIGAQGKNGDIGALGTPDAGVTGLGITGLAGYFSGDVWVTGEYRDSSDSAGVSADVLTSTGSGTAWGAMDWTNLANIPADIADGDDDTQLTEGEVDTYVANNGYVSLWGDIPDIPADIADGDDDTQLSEGEVDTYVANNGYVSSWGDIPDIPAGFADGVDDIGGPDSDWTISGSDMYSIPSGNVGIGTTSPSEVLDVNGNININSVYKIGGATILSNTGPNNIFVGDGAGVSITTGYSNSAVGYQALYDNNEGRWNSAVGHYALYSNTTGNDNSAMGFRALWSTTTGSNNSAVGRDALRSNTTGNDNSAVGLLALRSNTEGYYNSALGRGALIRNTTGNYNVGVGGQANSYNQEGSRNTIIGYEAGRGTTYHNKSGNVFLGHKAGYSETGDNKLYIANDSADANTLIYGDFSAGNVGIGTTTPASTLHVAGTGQMTGFKLSSDPASGHVLTSDASGVGTWQPVPGGIGGSGTANYIPKFIGATNLSDSVIYETSGNVGIGTTIPADRLEVLGNITARDGDQATHFIPDAANNRLRIDVGGTGHAADQILLGDPAGGDNDVVTLGKVGIGTTSPAGKLHVVGAWGDTKITGNGNAIEMTRAGSNWISATDAAGVLSFGAGGDTDDMVIKSYGYVGIGTTMPQGKLHVQGTFFVSNLPEGDHRNVQWNASTGQFYQDNSSRRFKENITPIDDDFRKILKVAPKTYTRPGNPDRWEVGYIAEEFVEAGLEKLVWFEDEEHTVPDGINYEKVVLYTNEIVKEHHQTIQALHTQIDEQRRQIEGLLRRIEAIEGTGQPNQFPDAKEIKQ
jgi:hypothetical protein